MTALKTVGDKGRRAGETGWDLEKREHLFPETKGTEARLAEIRYE